MAFCAPCGTIFLSLTQHSQIFFDFLTRMSPVRHHPLILDPQHSSRVSSLRWRSWWKPFFCRDVYHLSLDFHMTHLSDCWRLSIVSALSASSIESHMYAVFFVSSFSCSSEESHAYSVSPDSSSCCSSRGVFMLDESSAFVCHQVSLLLETVGKKVGAVTAGSPWISSTCQTRLIVWRMCLVGVKMLAVSSCRWVAQDS